MMIDKVADSFPWDIPQKKPARELSQAMTRLYDNYLTPRPEDNPLFTSFKYTRLKGFDYSNNDGTVSRRDPSKIISVNGLYYMWYTKRDTPVPPQGPEGCNNTAPSTDWDLADIWYATSEDGFTWDEQGIAVGRPEKPNWGWRSVCTPDILVWEGKYYLYYQAFVEPSMVKGDNCPVTVSVADSPDGPWTPHNQLVVPNGEPGSWDQYSVHGPYLLLYQDKIHFYYKAAFGDRPDYLVGLGLATAEHPLGPFEKHPLNPIMNSGHETTFFPFKEGIAAFAIRNGNESNSIQFSPDGVNFSLAATTSMMPVGAKPYNPEAFTNTKYGHGIQWGICHFSDKKDPTTKHSYLGRFDCNLMLNDTSKDMKETDVVHAPSAFFAQRLSPKQAKARRTKALE
ncbi:glycoside hydrolase family 117 protein [Agaribacter marinus]|nr:glycoside hydrolase [Agaribacter marinus]